MPLDNKISNIIGTKLPQWVLNQLGTRANKNTQNSRDNDNILYLTNKSAWIRLVSSVNINSLPDLNYFKNQIGANIEISGILNPTSLAKQYVLYGGTSKYLNNNSYGLRSGINNDGAYGMLGKNEIQQFGYKPMPGITSVTIDTQGRLGSIRAATINFKCWDKSQLDIIDALYFKLGFTMFLEWGHTYFYYSGENNQQRDPNKIVSTELYSIDPFEEGLTKEDIYLKIAQNSRNTEGNYEAMLGIVTNFNFTYTQDGGYDCSIRLMGLGVLGDSIKINNSGTLPAILAEEIIQLNNILLEISKQSAANQVKKDENPFAPPSPSNDLLSNLVSDLALYIPDVIPGKLFARLPESSLKGIAFANKDVDSERAKKTLRSELKSRFYSDNIVIFPYTANFKIDDPSKYDTLNEKDFYKLDYVVERSSRYFISDRNLIIDKKASYSEIVLDIDSLQKRWILSNPNTRIPSFGFFQVVFNTEKPLLNKDAGSSDRDIFEGTSDIVKYVYQINYKNSQGKQFYLRVRIPAGVNSSFTRRSIIEKIFKDSTFRDGRLSFGSDYFTKTPSWPNFSYSFNLVLKLSAKTDTGEDTEIDVLIDFNDSSLIYDIQTDNENLLLTPYGKTLKDRDLIAQNITSFTDLEEQVNEKEALDTQIKQALNYQSTLEIMLRTIQLHALNKAITDRNKDLEIGRETYVLEIFNSKDVTKNKTFLSQIFSTGVFSGFINKLVSGSINDSAYTVDSNGNYTQKMVPQERFEIQSKYGFATSLLGNKAPISEIPEVNFKELLKAYVVPYQINQEIIKGTSTNHPVYIPLGLVLMILNHSCTIYDSNNDGSFQTPLVYIDFNPETNFFLTNGKQLSTDPWTCLIPFQGSFDDYKALFDKDILIDGGTAIQPTSGSTEKVPLFNPDTNDFLSGTLPKIKLDTVQPSALQSKYVSSGLAQFLSSEVGKYSGNLYRGKTMNILVSIDYLVKLAQQYSYKDGTNSVYLKTFIEQMLNDINKSLGNFNSFRLSYNDSANTFQIVDDQFIPSLSNEDQVTPKTNTTELPLSGKFSIAKSLEIKSEISSKLSNMLAISANANSQNKAALSTNGDSFGFINTEYVDRYISNRGEISGSNNQKSNNDTLKISAQQFNSAISDFYSKINPSETSVSHATNYYIEKMALVKNNEYATRASSMIPVSINFTTDGISGLSMGQAFTVPDILLPYTYTTRKIPGAPQDHLKNVGFAVVGLTHTIENNQWNTAVRANMIYLKDKTEFTGSVVRVDKRVGPLGVNENNAVSLSIESVSLSDLNINQSWQDIAAEFIAKKEGFLDRPKPDEGTLRAGYGTDKIVTADGTVKSVGIDTVFTKEDARRTLIYQIKNTFSRKVISQIEKQNWDRLNDKQKAALVSYAYNAGSLRPKLVKAIKSNAPNQIVANAIIAGPTTGAQSGRVYPALIQRRKEEAALYLS